MKILIASLIMALALLGCSSDPEVEVKDSCVIRGDGKVILCYESAIAVDSAACRTARFRATEMIDIYHSMGMAITQPDSLKSKVEAECPSGRKADCPFTLSDTTRTLQLYDTTLIAICD